MPAIITNKFRVHNAKSFIGSALNYYMFIGRPQVWADDLIPDVPIDTIQSSVYAWDDIMSLKKIDKASNMSHGIVKRSWASGKYYDIYRHDYGVAGVAGVQLDVGTATTPTTLAMANYYVVSNDKVYICISNGNGAAVASTVNPSTLVPDVNYICSGGIDTYVWKLVGKASTADVIKFATIDYYPTKTLSSDPGVGDQYYDQWLQQERSKVTAGAIFKFKLDNGGTGYGANLVNAAGIASVKGDGTGCTVNVFTNGTGTITALSISNIGSGYTWAAISFITGTLATAVAIISPPKGLGTDPIGDLNAFNVITNIRFEYADGDDFPVTNDYRRIGMIVHPAQFGSSSTPLTVATASAMTTIKITPVSGSWVADAVVEDATTKARGRIVDVTDGIGADLGKKIVRIIRTSENSQSTVTNAVFVTANTISIISGGTASGTIFGIVSPEVDPDSGSLIYIENRRPIMRSVDQVEDIKLVLEF